MIYKRKELQNSRRKWLHELKNCSEAERRNAAMANWNLSFKFIIEIIAEKGVLKDNYLIK
jgi:hypothetical protein